MGLECGAMRERERHVVIAVTGASGAAYGLDLVRKLSSMENVRVHLVCSPNGRRVLEFETGTSFQSLAGAVSGGGEIVHHDADDMFACIASGSFDASGMAVAPCSMSTLAHIATGAGTNLVHRAADVMLKERRPLVLVPRETPLSAIQIENMLAVSRAGAVVLPAMPSFYRRPASVEELVETVTFRVLCHLGFPVPPEHRWEGPLGGASFRAPARAGRAE